jgi:hypothetical protein
MSNASKTRATLGLAALLVSLPATASIASAGARFAPDFAPAPCKVIYLSDKTTARDYLYKSYSPWTAYAPLPALPAADNGWGLWATYDLIYAGEAPNKINVHKPCGSQIGFTLTTFGSGPPTSIAVDTSASPSNTYATEYLSSTIDWFSGATDTPAAYDSPRAPGLPFYLAVDNVGNVFTSGWDPTNGVEQIDECSPHMVGCHVCEVLPTGSWPGGVALDGFQNLIVNSETGTLYVFHPSCGSLASAYVYSTGKFTFTDITVNTAENQVWGANQFDIAQVGCSAPYCMDAQAVKYVPSALAPVIGPLLPATHTTPIRHAQQPGSGIAIWPPGPV